MKLMKAEQIPQFVEDVVALGCEICAIGDVGYVMGDADLPIERTEVIIGGLAAAAAFSLFQLLLLFVRPAWLKLLVLLVFVTPAVVAGYHATFGIVKLTMPSEPLQVVFATVGAIAVGITAFMRLTMLASRGPAEQGVTRIS